MKTVNSLPVSVHTKDRYQSWFAVDFGYQVSVLPTHYSLRYAATEAENYQPKNWMLLATNDTNALKNDDDPNWVILDKQTNSSYLLKGDYVFHTWKIDHDYSIENGWRIFKVVQIDKNHGGNHVFAVTSFELYGFLKERRKSTQSPDDYLNLKSTPPSIHCNPKVISYKGRSKGIIDLLKETDNERIGVYSSSISKGKVRDFITKAKTPLGTKSEPFSWFAIDLGEGRTVFPQHYQLQFASTQVEFCPRNWLLQGTNKIESLYVRNIKFLIFLKLL